MVKKKGEQDFKIELVAIGSISPNDSNPRVIKDDKFLKLVKSIREFPQMLKIRPIVVDANMVVLGGNMRLRACIEAGLSEVPIIKADSLTDEQKQRFIISDNVAFGEWDWDTLANDWDMDELKSWGGEEKKTTAKQKGSRYKIVNDYYNFKLMIHKNDIDRLMDKLEYVMLENGFETHSDALLHIADKHKR